MVAAEVVRAAAAADRVSDMHSRRKVDKVSDMHSRRKVDKVSDMHNGQKVGKAADMHSGQKAGKVSDMYSGQKEDKASDMYSGQKEDKASDIDSSRKMDGISGVWNTQKVKSASRALWEMVFEEDTQQFLDYYDAYVADHNKIYTDWENGQAVSMRHRNPFRIGVGDRRAERSYIVAGGRIED